MRQKCDLLSAAGPVCVEDACQIKNPKGASALALFLGLEPRKGVFRPSVNKPVHGLD